MKKIMYLDIDGVVANTMESIKRVCGLPKEFVPRTYDFWIQTCLSRQDVFDKIKEDKRFWLDIEPYKDGMEIWKYCKEICETYGIPIVILTSPETGDPKFYEQRREWVARFLGEALLVEFAINKFIYAEKYHALIDDKLTNTESWKEHGGIGILVPRPWNSMTTEVVLHEGQIAQVCRAIETFVKRGE